MDDLDREIIRSLQRDARTPFTDIAKRRGVVDATIHFRVRRLRDAGIVRGFTVLLDYTALDFPVVAFAEVGVKPGTVDRVVRALGRIEGVLEVHELHGHCDVLVKLRARGVEHLRKKVLEIKRVKNLVSCEAHPVLRVVKEDLHLPVHREGEAP